MKISKQLFQVGGRLSRFAAAVISLPSRCASTILGEVSWRPPSWLSRISGAWRQLQRSYPRLVGLGILGVFLLACGTAATWRWYQDRPKPHRVYATVSPIPVTPLAVKLVFQPLKIRFSEPAARLEDIRQTHLHGVRLEPEMPGFWFWDSDRDLTFYPATDWAADQKFRIVFEKKFFAPHVLMDRLVYEAFTAPFAIKITQLQFYTDPINPGQRQVTATFELSHAIAPGEIDRHLQLGMIGGSSLFPSGDAAPHFVMTYGMHNRLAYLRTSVITLPEHEDFMKITVSKGVRTTQGDALTKEGIEGKIRVPSNATMFRIDSIEGAIVRNAEDQPEQMIILRTSTDISTRELAKSIDIWLLPKKKVPASEKPDADENTTESDGDEDETNGNGPYWGEEESGDDNGSNLIPAEQWKSAADVPEEILASAKHVEFTALPSDKAHDRQHNFRIDVEGDGELYFQVRKGVRALGDYPLAENYKAVLRVPLFPREVEIQGKGGLLALNGERKLSIRSRALAGIEYEIARVSTAQINHLVSQTGGRFEHPHFKAPFYFNEENISRIALEHQPIALENKWKANYSAFDFSKYLQKPSDGGSERGLFFLTARGWDPVEKKPVVAVRDSRFVLVTDIGILTKKNDDKSQDLFLVSIKQGKPIAGATVELLGKNGVALLTSKTDNEGHCEFPAIEKSAREQSPVAFVARNGDDVAFIPYARQDRVLNFSRFDIDGVESVSPESLDAFLFTERGVYRPGDEIHAGMIVKQRNWQGQLKGLPLEMEVIDARGLSVLTHKVSMPESGFAEFSYQTANESPTGLYAINLYLVKNSKRTTLLGSTTANVKEFLPDRMKIETRLSKPVGRGWMAPEDVRAFVGLANLYGTPATDRRVTGKITLCPTAFRFPEFPDFVFYDPLTEQNQRPHSESIDLGEQKTDGNGHTEFELNLERFTTATYAMRFVTEGFEGEGGRSVTTEAGALVSALPYTVGFKAGGALTYIAAKKPCWLDLIAVDPKLNRIAIENLTLNIVAEEYVSVLTKQDNGNYAYESVLKERITHSERISISANGLRYNLPTDTPGDYVFELRDDQNRRLTKTEFRIVGRGTSSHSLENGSELDVKLNKAQYKSGEEIAISISAPYVGSGLITIERDKVYAYRWFQTTSATTVQHIVVPPDFDGSGYVNVAFVRALDSKEIFVSPLSYGVAPFTANLEKHRLKIDLDVPARVKPGDVLKIGYRTDRSSKIVLFAVDQGILQVTDYTTPDPLAFFFRKCALRVETSQIVDLIIPEFSILKSLSAFGGGGDIQHLNPFKRVTDKPVVFWSGIVDADATRREVTYEVPDFFDGNLKVMAVAVSNETIGSAERDSLIRGPFVITPSVPVLAAPGDEFEAGVTVANGMEGSGPDAEIQLRAQSNESLAILGPPVQALRIPEGRELSTTFRFRANEKLGSGEIRFTASRTGAETVRHSTLSVRPPVPYMTDVRSGNFKKESNEIPIVRSMHAEFQKRSATLSALPLGLAHGLDAYLKDFPYGCSEQITSGAFCRLILSGEADFGLSRAEAAKQLEYTFGVLRRRQNDQGGFGYWEPENGEQISFISAYVMDFLSEAKAAGFAPPAEMFAGGLRNLQRMVARDPKNISDARTLAYAIYVLTRENVITTNYILNLIDYLNKNDAKQWKSDITGVYLAGALHLLHKDADAETLIAHYRLENGASLPCDDFYQPLGTNSQYIAVLAREFPVRMKKITSDQFEQIVRGVTDGQFNTLSAAYAVRALKSYSSALERGLPELSIIEIDRDKRETQLVSGTKLLQRTPFSQEAKALQFRSGSRVDGPGLFFQVVEAGFDKQVPQEPLANGLEVYRELLGRNNQPVTQTSLGEPVRVRLHVRSLQHKPITNVAVVDLLPGGFEVVDSSVRRGRCPIGGVDYVDLREDRAVFFVTAPVSALEIDYKIKSCNRGDFVVPPVFAESMYDRNVKGRGVGGKITVTP